MSQYLIIFSDDYKSTHYGPFNKDEIEPFIKSFAEKYNINNKGFGNLEIIKNYIVLRKRNEKFGVAKSMFEKQEFFDHTIGEIIELRKDFPEYFIKRHGH